MTQVPVWHHPPAAGGPNVRAFLVRESSSDLEPRNVRSGDTVWADPDQRPGSGDLVIIRDSAGLGICAFEHWPMTSELVGRVTGIQEWRDILR